MTPLVREVHAALGATAGWDEPVRDDLLPAAACGTTPLPAGTVLPAAPLDEVVEGRRSSYRFGGQPVLPDVAALLDLGVGTAPRAGGLLSVVPYLVVADDGDLPLGVHRADLRRPVPGLALVRAGGVRPFLATALHQPPFAGRVPLWLALVADLSVARGRYPDRHYRTVHLDVGAAMQDVLLVATALGLRACPVSGFDDRALERLLRLDDDMFVGVLVALGTR